MSQKSRLIFDLFVRPIGELRSSAFKIIFALLILAVAQGFFLLLIGPFIKALFGIGLANEVISLAEIAPANIIKLFPDINQYAVKKEHLVIGIPLLILFTGIIKALATYIYNLNQQAIALFMAQNYRNRLFTALLSLPYNHITSKSPAKWMSLIMNDVMFLQSRYSEITATFIKDSVLIISCLIFIAILFPLGALILLVIAPFLAIALGKTGKRIAFFANAWQRELARIAGVVLDIRERFSFIKAQRACKIERQQFAKFNDNYYRIIRRSILLRASFAPGVEFVGFVIFAGFVLAMNNMGLKNGFGPIELFQFFTALGLLIRPLRAFGEQIARFQETKGSLTASFEVFHESFATPSPQLPARINLNSLNKVWEVDIQSLVTGYNQNVEFATQDLNLTSGELIAIVGPSGGGKSTLIRTLAGLIEPFEWQASASPDALREGVSLVSQNPFLFTATIRKNLLYGHPRKNKINEEKIWRILELIDIKKDIERLPQGLNTPIASLLASLSGGQIQRLVIARALLRNSKILLLDEATSALDVVTEKRIMSRIISYCRKKNRLLVSVTHRLSILNYFDHIWFIENKQLIAQGSHTDLLKNPRYNKFINSASLGSKN